MSDKTEEGLYGAISEDDIHDEFEPLPEKEQQVASTINNLLPKVTPEFSTEAQTFINLMSSLSRTANKGTSNNQAIMTALNSLRDEINELRGILNQLNQDRTANLTKIAELEEKLRLLTEQTDELNKKLTQESNRLIEALKQIQELEGENDNLLQRIGGHENNISSLTANISQLQSEIANLKTNIQTLETEKNELTQTTAQQVSQLTNELSTLQNKNYELEQKINALNLERTNMDSTNQDLQQTITRLEEEKKELEKQQLDLLNTIDKINEQNKIKEKELQDEIDKLKMRLLTQTSENSTFNEKIQSELEIARQRISELEAQNELSVMNAEDSVSKMQEILVKMSACEKQKGELNGIIEKLKNQLENQLLIIREINKYLGSFETAEKNIQSDDNSILDQINSMKSDVDQLKMAANKLSSSPNVSSRSNKSLEKIIDNTPNLSNFISPNVSDLKTVSDSNNKQAYELLKMTGMMSLKNKQKEYDQLVKEYKTLANADPYFDYGVTKLLGGKSHHKPRKTKRRNTKRRRTRRKPKRPKTRRR